MRTHQKIWLLGHRSDRLLVIQEAGRDKHGDYLWLCRCDCGNLHIARATHLKNGAAKSCGCIQSTDLTGQRFGRFTVLGRSEIAARKYGAYWNCICDCGQTFIRARYLLKHGDSCGCLRSETMQRRSTIHNMSHSPTYRSWRSAKDRCMRPKSISYNRYGGRGITICKEWLSSFEAFYRDMGQRPTGMTLERIDNNGNYEPGNCRWATPKEQQANRSR